MADCIAYPMVDELKFYDPFICLSSERDVLQAPDGADGGGHLYGKVSMGPSPDQFCDPPDASSDKRVVCNNTFSYASSPYPYLIPPGADVMPEVRVDNIDEKNDHTVRLLGMRQYFIAKKQAVIQPAYPARKRRHSHARSPSPAAAF